MVAQIDSKFPGGTRFHYYVRGRDFRAKVVCEWPERRREMTYSSLPLNELHSKRDGSMLYLCRAIAGIGSNTVWAALKFPTVECESFPVRSACTDDEVLIIFHCTFLALRSYDNGKRTMEVFDHDLHGETTFFAGSVFSFDAERSLTLAAQSATAAIGMLCASIGIASQERCDWKPLCCPAA